MVRFRPAWLLATCILIAACGGGREDVSAPDEQTPLHGSAAIIAEQLIPISEDEPAPDDSQVFRRYFRRLGRIRLSDVVVIGGIESVGIDGQGRLLVTDGRNHQVFLFGPDGRSIRELSAEACDPGFTWRPNDAVFSPQGEILTVHNGRRHVRFDTRGECSSILNLRSALYRSNVLTAGGEVFALSFGPESYGVSHFYRDGDRIELMGESRNFHNFMSRYVAGDMVLDDHGRLYLGLPVFEKIFVFDTTGVAYGTMGSHSEFFQQMDSDIPIGTLGEEYETARDERLSRSSILIGLQLLDRDKLLLAYMNRYEDPETSDKYIAIRVMSTDGRALTAEPIFLRRGTHGFAGARDGLAYQVTDPVERDDGDWGNQGFDVYRFVL